MVADSDVLSMVLRASVENANLQKNEGPIYLISLLTSIQLKQAGGVGIEKIDQ